MRPVVDGPDLGQHIDSVSSAPQSLPLDKPHSTVTLFARFRGLSTSVPRASAAW